MKVWLVLLTLGAVLILGGGGARGDSGDNEFFSPLEPNEKTCGGATPQMNFSLIHGHGGNVLFAGGLIHGSDVARFSVALKLARPIREILLCSPGGNLEAGINMGYLIHDNRLATRLVSGAYCASACNFMFMGGIVRTVEPGAIFKVHMFANEEVWQLLEADAQKTDWSIAGFALSHPDAMVAFKEQIGDFIEGYKKAHQKELQNDLQHFLKAHPDSAPMPLDKFEESDPESQVILSGALRDFAIEEDIKGIQQFDAQAAAGIAEFLIAMRLSLHFLTAFANIQNDAPRELTRSELIQYNIINAQ